MSTGSSSAAPAAMRLRVFLLMPPVTSRLVVGLALAAGLALDAGFLRPAPAGICVELEPRIVWMSP